MTSAHDSVWWTTRASWGVLVLTALAWLLPEQTADMLANIAEDSSAGIAPALAFHGTLFFMAFSLWHWTRAALSAEFELRDSARLKNAAPAWVNLLPRMLYFGTALVGAIAAARSAEWFQLAITVSWAAVGYTLLHYRLQIQEALHIGELTAGPSPMRKPRWAPIDCLFGYAPLGRNVAVVLFSLAAFLFVFGAVTTFFPNRFGWSLGPNVLGQWFPGPAAVFAALGLAIGPFTVLTYFFDHLYLRLTIFCFELPIHRIWILSVLFVIVLATSGIVDLHSVRVSTEPEAVSFDTRMPLAEFFRAWADKCAPGDQPARPIIVALSGGASRAGLWGARVLTTVDAAARERGGSIFAISSVSGGSLGAAAYVATVKGQGGSLCTLSNLGDRTGQRDTAVTEAIRSDVLGPLLAGALFGDTPRSLFGGPVWLVQLGYDWLAGTETELRGGDRAEAHERAFEHNWDAAVRALGQIDGAGSPASFSDPFLSLFYEDKQPRGNVPIWIANGTDQQNGNRIITAPFEINSELFSGETAPPQWSTLERGIRRSGLTPARSLQIDGPFFASLDALDLLQADVPVSTAITNTARFPFLSPSGEMNPVRRVKTTAAQIIDGGYFENEGILTALELAQWLKRYGPSVLGRDVDPIIIQATADATADIEEKQIVRCGEEFGDDPSQSQGRMRSAQFLVPLIGVSAVRAAHSGVALRQTRMEFCGKGPAQSFFHFYLYEPKDQSIPLNWMLSRKIADEIWQHSMKACGNAVEYQRLWRVLAASSNAEAEGKSTAAAEALPPGCARESARRAS